MTRASALRELEEAAAVWVVFGGSPRAVIARAAEVLAGDSDTPALREIAGEHPEITRGEFAPLLERAFDELGLSPIDETSPVAYALALRGRAREFLADPRFPERFVRDVEDVIGPADIDGVRPFRHVVHAYDAAESLFTPMPTREAVVELAEWVVNLGLEESSARTRATPVSAPVTEVPDTRPRPLLTWRVKLALVGVAACVSVAVNAIMQVLRH